MKPSPPYSHSTRHHSSYVSHFFFWNLFRQLTKLICALLLNLHALNGFSLIASGSRDLDDGIPPCISYVEGS